MSVDRGRALVTGASSGIGEAFAKALSARGWSLVLVARRRERLEALATALGGDVEVLTADLAHPDGLAAVEARLAIGDVELLVNNAGIGSPGAFADGSVARVGDVLALNVVAVTRLTHAALGPMRAARRGAIVQVASLAAFQPNPYFAVYGGTKAYVLSFSEALHEEVRSEGVQVLTVCPGFTRTEFQAANGAEADFLPAAAWGDAHGVVDAVIARLGTGAAVVVPRWGDWVAAVGTRFVPRFLLRRLAGFVGRRV